MMNPARWMSLGFAMARLTAEANMVIALRMARFASGHPDSGIEATRMVSEKMRALGSAQAELAKAAATGRLDRAAPKVVAMYRRKVRANRKRLTR
ncbi:hypothetical protein MWN34_01085 [Ancylobacter sp. 6x-1]|uniref:Antifreeze protein n=1 Tax=Ancylobacter crimeensis TaxID=2579147 RepID=A0ABT0D6B7_9HYPH|nr:hypothetical protein [Ancylobacter crimeensis]MCK0195500.1 hypothetical protein [Ancylobacter crimeensis]